MKLMSFSLKSFMENYINLVAYGKIQKLMQFKNAFGKILLLI